jgi:hypothetical protein
MMMARK